VERFGPTRRGGPVFRWLGEPLAVDLANTVMVVREDEIVDLIADPEDLKGWLHAERGRVGDCAFAVAHIEEIRALRDAVRALLSAATRGAPLPSEALQAVNAASRAAPIAPQLKGGGAGELRLGELTTACEPLARLLGALARSAIALLTGPERERLHLCNAPSCGMVFIGARRWCCAACGNRARAARHYRHQREQATRLLPLRHQSARAGDDVRQRS
jgi:predicted RNA-binding Zn ribbon-like protein